MAKNNKANAQEQESTQVPKEKNVNNKIEHFLEDKKKLRFTGGIGMVIIVAVVGFFIYKNTIETKNNEASEEMFQAIYYFEEDSLRKALDGDGLNYGLLKIIADYEGTPTANLANFYAGSSYVILGEFENAIPYLKNFKSDDYLLQARAFALLGDSYAELKQLQDAITYYKKASEYKPNKIYTHVYLYKLAVVLEENQDYLQASQVYDKILKEYPSVKDKYQALKNKVRLEGLASKK